MCGLSNYSPTNSKKESARATSRSADIGLPGERMSGHHIRSCKAYVFVKLRKVGAAENGDPLIRLK